MSEHIVGCAQERTIPTTEKIAPTSARAHDIITYEPILLEILQYDKFADKAYYRSDIRSSKPHTSIKSQEYLEVADALYFTAISRIRLPTE